MALERFQPKDPFAGLALQDMLAATVAMGTWGLVTGVAMVQSGLSTAQAIGMSLLVFAGSAQLASLPLLAAGTPLPIIWISALILNLRFVIYSVAIRPFFKQHAFFRKLAYGVGGTDVVVAEFLKRFEGPNAQALSRLAKAQGIETYFRTAAVLIWVVWQACSLVGILLAHMIPTQWSLEFVATLALLAMLLPMLTDRASLLCVLIAGAIAGLTVWMPLNLGVILAVIGGVSAAMLIERPPKVLATTEENRDSAS